MWRVYLHAYFITYKPTKQTVLEINKALADPHQRFCHTHFMKICLGYVAICGAISLVAGSVSLLVAAWALPVVFSFHGSSLVDVFCHTHGYMTYTNKSAGNSRNNLWVNFLLLGNGLHNNHHGNPRAYSLAGEQWYEFDLWGAFIRKFMVRP
jgi:stearoyl-CoA desaturase (delta-9 desaturase)